MPATSFHQPWFVRKDLDGFFGLMIDNLIQLILIVSLCRELIHFPDSLIFGKILPGAAISILVGNFFYSWQARRLAQQSGREDVTALPYGINNTVSLFAHVFFIMLPTYLETKDPVWAWKVGLVACFFNGLIEILGAFVAETVRRVTPRAALLSALSGIAITFIAMDFTFKIFAQPLVAFAPMAVILSRIFPAKIALGIARRHGGNRDRHGSRMVVGHHEREAFCRPCRALRAELRRPRSLGSADGARLSQLFLGHSPDTNF
jgi:xanthine/uracil/vitamin C permease (AzgA family)